MSVGRAVFNLLLALPVAVLSYPDGVPHSACGDMKPNHDPYMPATGPSPYKLEIRQSSASAGTPVSVTIMGWRHHEGFIMQAQDTKSGAMVGSWQVAPNGLTQLMTCFQTNDTIVHTTKVHKDQTALLWQSPKDYRGTVVFKATVVGSYPMFWTGLTSAPFNVVAK